MFTLPAMTAMRDRIRLTVTGIERIGADLRIDAIPMVGSGTGDRAGGTG